MKQPAPSLEQILETHLQTLALTLRPSTVAGYRGVARRFLVYLRAAFPRLRRLSQLRRDPHLPGWLRSLCDQSPALRHRTREIHLLVSAAGWTICAPTALPFPWT